MKIHRGLYLAIALAVVGAVRMPAQNITIVVNPSVAATSASSDEIKGVFLQTKSVLSDGSHVQAVINKGGPYEAFTREYLGKSVSALEIYYRSLVFSGTGSIPKTFSSDRDVIEYVAKTKGAIGYVGSAVNATGVKTLALR